MVHEGGCFCGEIRYAFDSDEVIAADCHCTMCRKTSAAPYVSWLVVPIADFKYTKGEPKELRSSAKGRRFFCAECGTPVVCLIGEHPDAADITLGSLDDPEAFLPVHTVHADTKLSFVTTHALNHPISSDGEH